MEQEKPVENVSKSCQDVCLKLLGMISSLPVFWRARVAPGQLELWKEGAGGEAQGPHEQGEVAGTWVLIAVLCCRRLKIWVERV